ncbi:MAG: hypothetical protein H0V51_07830 [Chloroflexi bacterium]|nr:hypothetical protein [Chloroflexota bacterium]
MSNSQILSALYDTPCQSVSSLAWSFLAVGRFGDQLRDTLDPRSGRG